jgi:hypothetical protein
MISQQSDCVGNQALTKRFLLHKEQNVYSYTDHEAIPSSAGAEWNLDTQLRSYGAINATAHESINISSLRDETQQDATDFTQCFARVTFAPVKSRHAQSRESFSP